MNFINDTNLDAKAIDIVTNYITAKSSKWVSLRLPECMHIDGDAWVYEKYFEENDPYNGNIEIIWKFKSDLYARYILICDSRLFVLSYSDITETWLLRVYGIIDSEIIKNTEKEKEKENDNEN